MGVLKIKDKNGNWISIEAIKGADGKSAYEQAKEGGYTGTEEEFVALLNGLTNFEDAGHYINYNNPHKVTPSQIGALAITGGTLTGKTLYFDNGNARISGGEDYMQMDVFDSPKDDSNRRKLVVNGNKTALNDAVVLTVKENGEDNTYTIYGRHNKPSGSYTGSGEARAIDIGGNGKLLLIYRFFNQKMYAVAFISSLGGMGILGGYAHTIDYLADAYFFKGVLYIENITNSNVLGCLNQLDATYYWQVL